PAVRLAVAGFVPVPHVAVRNFSSVAALEAFLSRMVGEAGVRRILIIAGDRDQPAGAFRDPIEAIDSGPPPPPPHPAAGTAGYPEGHARLARHELDRALTAKIEIAAQIGLKVHIVTQFGFAAEPIIAWIERLRDFGIENPVRIGLAGPSNITTLLRYARRCGVRGSAPRLAPPSGRC